MEPTKTDSAVLFNSLWVSMQSRFPNVCAQALKNVDFHNMSRRLLGYRDALHFGCKPTMCEKRQGSLVCETCQIQ